MGPCPSNFNVLTCVFASSFYSDSWLFSNFELPPMGGDANTITVSGISGGSSTSTQMHTIYSDDIKGAGLMIGAPYGDKWYGNPWNWFYKVGTNYGQEGIDYALEFEKEGKIDSTANLKNDPVWIFSGELDKDKPPAHQNGQRDYYNHFQSNVDFVSYPIGHEVPSKFYTLAFGDKSYDTVGTMLSFVLGNLEIDPIASLQPADMDWQSSGVFRRFSQADFLDTSIFQVSGLADYGYIYYPYRCIDGTNNNCKIHMALAGCFQTTALGGYSFMEQYGYNHYAASNDLIVVYPSHKWSLMNYLACFDYKGYTNWFIGKRYMTREGPQMKALKAMLDRLKEPREPDNYDYYAKDFNINSAPLAEKLFWEPYLLLLAIPEFCYSIISMFGLVFYQLIF